MIKNLLLTLFLASSACLLAQKYHFDYQLQYQPNHFNNPRTILVSSSDPSLVITFRPTDKPDITEGILRDRKSDIIHYFAVKEEPANSETFHFTYTGSQVLSKDPHPKSKKIEIKQEERFYYIYSYESAKDKKPTTTVKLELQENSDNIFYLPIDRGWDEQLQLLNQLKEHLPADKKFIIKSFLVKYKTGVNYSEKLINRQKIDLTLQVDKVKLLKK